MDSIRLGSVSISEETKASVMELLDRGVIGQSEAIKDFEDAFAKWLGVKYCVAVSSGTMADTIALAVLKHFNPARTEVILPALTFAAQLNAVLHNGLKPVFVDIGEGHNMAGDIEPLMSSRTLCLFPAHIMGRPADLRGLATMAGHYKVHIIEDSCEAMGAEYDMSAAFVKCGTIGDMGTFSFYPSHVIGTGEGGMISTNNAEFADMARIMRNHGKRPGDRFKFDVTGFNGKMASIQAVLGLAALKTVDETVKKRRGAYFALGGKEKFWEKVSPHAFPFICKSEDARDKKMESLAANGIECRNLFSSLPTQETAYQGLGYRPGDFPIAEEVGRCGLYVPCHQGLTAGDTEKIRGALEA